MGTAWPVSGIRLTSPAWPRESTGATAISSPAPPPDLPPRGHSPAQSSPAPGRKKRKQNEERQVRHGATAASESTAPM